MSQPRAIVPDSGVRAGFNAAVTAIGKGRLVTYDAANGTEACKLATAATDSSYGLTMEEIAPSRAGNVQKAGKGICIAGAGGVSPGANITSDAAGGGIITTTAGNQIFGVCVSAAAAGLEFELDLDARPTVKA